MPSRYYRPRIRNQSINWQKLIGIVSALEGISKQELITTATGSYLENILDGLVCAPSNPHTIFEREYLESELKKIREFLER